MRDSGWTGAQGAQVCFISRGMLRQTAQGRTVLVEFLIAAGLMGGVGIVLALVLAYADKKFYVWEDPRIDQVEVMFRSPTAARAAARLPRFRRESRAWRDRAG